MKPLKFRILFKINTDVFRNLIIIIMRLALMAQAEERDLSVLLLSQITLHLYCIMFYWNIH